MRQRIAGREILVVAVIVALGAASVAIAPGVAPAQTVDSTSTTPVTVTLANGVGGDGRTLSLYDDQGQPITQTSGISVADGSSVFTAQVADTNYANDGYVVEAAMSNLYGYDSSTSSWDCSNSIPAGDLSLSVPSTSLEIANVSASVTPVFDLTGTLPLDLGSVSDTAVDGVSQTLGESALVQETGDLFEGTLSSLPSHSVLPIGVSLDSASPTPFTTAAPAPSASGCTGGSANPTEVPVMTGTADGDDLDEAGGPVAQLAAGLGGTASSLVGGGLLDTGSVLDALEQATSDPVNALDGTLSSLLSGLSATLDTSDPPVAVTQSGDYYASPIVSVAAPAGASGEYQGVLTVTLLDD